MEIQNCPILRPTVEQFSNFYEYIDFLDRTYKNDFGMVKKVIPPEGWRARSNEYDKVLDKLQVKNAIQQNVQGKGGFYQSKNIVRPKMTYKAYRKYSESQSEKVKNKTVEQKQQFFWKTITYSPPIYGADLTGTLMDETAGSWNMNKLDSVLKYAMPSRVKGVTDPYCYIGTWKAFFSWHKQDLDLSAINYIHQGAPKIWYSICYHDSWVLQKQAKNNFRTQYQHCKQFLRHKTFLINPKVLLNKNPNLKISKTVHQAGEIMLVFGGAYHSGFNCGFNIAQAVNYATIDWFKQLIDTKPCSCSKRSVKVQKESVLYNLQNSEKYEDFIKKEEFLLLCESIRAEQLREGFNTFVDEKPQIIINQNEHGEIQTQLLNDSANRAENNLNQINIIDDGSFHKKQMVLQKNKPIKRKASQKPKKKRQNRERKLRKEKTEKIQNEIMINCQSEKLLIGEQARESNNEDKLQ